MNRELLKKLGLKFLRSTLSAVLVLAFFFTATLTFADEEGGEETPPASEASVQVVMNETEEDSGLWRADPLSTSGLKFMIRGKEAMAWTLEIENAGFDSPAIKSSYNKVLTIVNSLFILGLLVIAGMWMFSILIPRPHLKQVILIYVLAVIFVNFAMPLNRLFIDGTNLLQKTFLTQEGKAVNIVDIVETPEYNHVKTIALHQFTDDMGADQKQRFTLKVDSEGEDETSVSIAEIEPDTENPATLHGTLSTGDSTTSGQIILEAGSGKQIIALKDGQEITLAINKTFDPNREHGIFAFVMMFLTGLAYFLIALVFILRIVILWALMILSPILFLLAIFRTTRGYFFGWLNIYGRWLVIGPLMALGIAIIINIWKTVGLPIISSYAGNASLGNPLNIAFMLPGSEMSNNLSTTSQMMEYIIFLAMLYLPLFFAFVLIRQKLWNGLVSVLVEHWKSGWKKAPHGLPPLIEGGYPQGPTPERPPRTVSWKDNLRNLIDDQITKITKTAFPKKIKISGHKSKGPIPSASSFLRDELQQTKIPDMLTLLGVNKESRHSREEVIKKLAAPQLIQDTRERRKISSVLNEIHHRAKAGDAEAKLLYSEIGEKSKSLAKAGLTAPMEEKETVIQTKETGKPNAEESANAINLNAFTTQNSTTNIINKEKESPKSAPLVHHDKMAKPNEVKNQEEKTDEEEESEKEKTKPQEETKKEETDEGENSNPNSKTENK